MMASTYDFIIVGAGTAGCLLAHRLAHAAARPSVLLVEAGPEADDDEVRHPANRYMVPIIRPDLDYAYESTPQKNLNDRTIVYERGRGLGGSTLLNYGVYLYGSREDYNRWADLVGDESWRWENTQKSFRQIENYDFSGRKSYPRFADPNPEDHGTNGQVRVCLPSALERGTAEIIEAFVGNDETLNPDLNSGNPVGIGIIPQSASRDGRTTSATAHLKDVPDNLVVWTNAVVHRMKFDGEHIKGIESADGRIARCRKDVIVCGGAIDTPRLLLLNGIGPSAELEAHGIRVVKDLPGVGKNLADHVVTWLSCEVDGSLNDRYALESDEPKMASAKSQWTKDKTGPFKTHNGELWGGFSKLARLHEYDEFKNLDPSEQEFLSREAVPTHEMAASPCLWPPGEVLDNGNTYLTANHFMMNTQSRGFITLQSSNPKDRPIIDLGFLSHPYDRIIMRESFRETWRKLYENPLVRPKVVRKLCGPKSLSNADIDEYLREQTLSVRHMNGTVKMGRADDALACVDASFKVFGVHGLRIADLSVCPVLPCNHTQTTAYLIGQKAADKVIDEYRLDEREASRL